MFSQIYKEKGRKIEISVNKLIQLWYLLRLSVSKPQISLQGMYKSSLLSEFSLRGNCKRPLASDFIHTRKNKGPLTECFLHIRKCRAWLSYGMLHIIKYKQALLSSYVSIQKHNFLTIYEIAWL